MSQKPILKQMEVDNKNSKPEKASPKIRRYGSAAPQTFKNLCWGILGGWIVFVYFVAVGIIYGISVIGAKKAYMCFKFAIFTLAPFGKNVSVNIASHKFGNAFWIFTTGWQICLYCVVISGLLYLTYFGRYLAARWFHLAQFVITPFGAVIKPTALLTGDEGAIARIRDDNDFDLAK